MRSFEAFELVVFICFRKRNIFISQPGEGVLQKKLVKLQKKNLTSVSKVLLTKLTQFKRTPQTLQPRSLYSIKIKNLINALVDLIGIYRVGFIMIISQSQ